MGRNEKSGVEEGAKKGVVNANTFPPKRTEVKKRIFNKMVDCIASCCDQGCSASSSSQSTNSASGNTSVEAPPSK
ncbi:hypothetical protein CCACVL1_21638 [Corchorus capsularis]|uniref:Uncharacterized protein n=1 Tax=Corchorus capsularis TaxID=210143 RepID=A0A1R3H2Q1_COCAP|nr:hypothetical protein CCACVL1_21638 [Corchorus capsularis]